MEVSSLQFECLIFIMQREVDNNLVRRQPVRYEQEFQFVRRGDSGDELMREEEEEEAEEEKQQRNSLHYVQINQMCIQ